VAEVIGLNLLSGNAVDASQVQAGSLRVVTHGGPATGPVWVTVPPAAISLYRSRPDGSPRNTWSMTVRDVQLTGQSARVTLDGPARLTAEVTAAAVADLRLQVGQELWASVKATEVRAYPA
jgi:molybdate transport system ATP-binding protein